MIGSIHDCAINITSGKCRKVLIRDGAKFRSIKADSAEGEKAIDPMFCDVDNLIGVFTPTVPIADIYEAAGEPVPSVFGEVAA